MKERREKMLMSISEEQLEDFKRFMEIHLNDAMYNIAKSLGNLQSAFENVKQGLGPHNDAIVNLLERGYTNYKELQEPVKELYEDMMDLYEAYKTILRDDLFFRKER